MFSCTILPFVFENMWGFVRGLVFTRHLISFIISGVLSLCSFKKEVKSFPVFRNVTIRYTKMCYVRIFTNVYGLLV